MRKQAGTAIERMKAEEEREVAQRRKKPSRMNEQLEKLGLTIMLDNTMEELAATKTSSSKRRPYCADCNRHFIDIAALDQHTRSKHHAQNLYCFRCNQSFSTVFNMEIHWKTSSNHNICATCAVDYPNRKEYEGHMESQHPVVNPTQLQENVLASTPC